MIRSMTFLWAGLAILCGIALFLVKYQVQSLEGRLLTLDRTIRQDRVDIHVLRAEWAYLNAPKRLADAAEKFLTLRPALPEQYTSVTGLPLRPPALDDDTLPGLSLKNPWASFPLQKPSGDKSNGDRPKTALIALTPRAPVTPANPLPPAATLPSNGAGAGDFAALNRLIKAGGRP